jgi:hypothetical protein
MEPDVRFFGFGIAAAEIGDWSIVIAEQPTAPRFGIEVADVSELPRSIVLGQASNGVAVRMSLLYLMLEGREAEQEVEV